MAWAHRTLVTVSVTKPALRRNLMEFFHAPMKPSSLPAGDSGIPTGARVWLPVTGLSLLWFAGSIGLLLLVGRPHPGSQWDVLWDDSLRGLLSLLAGLACLARARHPQEPYPRPWRAFGAAHLWHAAATAYLVVILDLAKVGGWWGGLRHFGYLATLLYLGKGVLAWPAIRKLPTQRMQMALDGLLVGGSALFLAWGMLLKDLAQRDPALSFPYLFTVAYPTLAVAIGAIWFFQETRSAIGYFRGPLNFLRLGLGLEIVTQCLYASLSIHGAYRSDLGTRLDILLGAGTLCFGLAALWPRTETRPMVVPSGRSAVPRLTYLPVLAAMVYGALRVTLGHSGDAVLAWTGCILGALLCLREYLALRDLSELSGSLEARVEARTAELRRSQVELLRNQRVQAVASMAAGLSHDLKNLFGIIQSWSAMVRMEQGAAAHEGLGMIEQTAARGHHMVQDLLAVGRQVPMNPRPFELGAYLWDARPLLEAALKPGVKLIVELPHDHLLVVMDPEQLEATLVNLVANAVDAIPGEGTITLASRQDPAEPFALLEVRDTGSGIPPDHLERIFEPFFTTKAPGKGSGLGLSSVQGILAQCGGDIQVTSEPGKGTTFTLVLPQRAMEGSGALPAS